MSEQLTTNQPLPAELAEKVFIGGDLKSLNAAERLLYYTSLCESLHVNPVSRPFEYITLNGKLTLYGTKELANQLRRRDSVSITDIDTKQGGDLIVVTVKASTPGGRTDADVGAASTRGLRGEALANAIMKCVTRSKRRVTLSICGVGFLDETEIESIPGARREVSATTELAATPASPPAVASPRTVDTQTGEVIEPQPVNTSRHTAIEQSSNGWRACTLAALLAFTAKSSGNLRGVTAYIQGPLKHRDTPELDQLTNDELLALRNKFVPVTAQPTATSATTQRSDVPDDELITTI